MQLVFRIYPDGTSWWDNDPSDLKSSSRDPYCYRWDDLEEDSPEVGNTILAGETATIKVPIKIVNPHIIDPSPQGQTPFEIQNTELYFIGPKSDIDNNGYGIRTSESTTVVNGVPVVSGLASIYDGDMIILRNQGGGPIFLDTFNDKPMEEPKVITGGPGKMRLIPFQDELATIKFHVKSRIDGKEHKAYGTINLRK